MLEVQSEYFTTDFLCENVLKALKQNDFYLLVGHVVAITRRIKFHEITFACLIFKCKKNNYACDGILYFTMHCNEFENFKGKSIKN